uniref:LRR receptor-like serine/threonine-protein kinase GSO1 n=1 Tax=Aegilops tauschii TaxID=37682 RepID=R7W1R9_AEGTA
MATTTRPSSHSCLFLILAAASTIFTVLSVHASDIPNGGCIAAERAALLSFKAGVTSDPANRLVSWHGHNCCHWSGVRCDNWTGHVTKLDLRNDLSMKDLYGFPKAPSRSLRGQVSSSLLALRHLKHLDLSGNFLGGENMPIPGFMGSLDRLAYLNLSNMNFYGRVPPQLGNLSKLVHLDISPGDSYLYSLHSMDISWLARLYSLEHLDMGSVDLKGATDWVHSLNALPSLVVLNLDWCNLQNNTPSLVHYNLTVLEELDLSYNSLDSLAASNWFWGVTSLKRLILLECGLSGSFPDVLGNLTLLETLDLGFNNINGMIPGTLKNMCKLKSLVLSYNNIGGDISDLVERLPNCSLKILQEFCLSEANVTGTTLNSLLNLTSIRIIHAGYNHLSGPLPVEIATLTNLTEMLLGGNNLSGVISEDHFAGLTNLKILDLSCPNLEVTVDSGWVTPFRLDTAQFGSCQLGPEFPKWLRGQNGISDLDISNTGLITRIPHWFWTTFSGAEHLDMSSNQLSGNLPINLEFMSVITLYLHSNCLTGLVPKLPRTIEVLDISRNSLNGFVSSNLEAPHLQVAVVFSNSMTGTIPTSICQWPQLRILDLSNNQLVGELPDCGRKELKQCKASSKNSSNVSSTCSSSLGITILLVSNNSLSGGFPLFLRKCRGLRFLDLSRNKFSGNLPTRIGEDMPLLVMLRLRSNNFSGHIPYQITELPALRILDLSNNNFSGAIPQSLDDLKALSGTAKALDPVWDSPFDEISENEGVSKLERQSDDSLSVVIKGQVLDYKENTVYLMSIDLSCNSLTGEIPEELSSLIGLINLNLSSNLLSGIIPDKIGDLQSLESLDLSKNKLAGEIPWGLSDLTYLSYLNLSYNNLSGRVPTGHQLDILNADDPTSMYIGNPGLCGYPTPRQCPGPPEDEPTHGDSVRWHKEGLSPTDLLLGLIVGFVAGVWMSNITSNIYKRRLNFPYKKRTPNLIQNLSNLTELGFRILYLPISY